VGTVIAQVKPGDFRAFTPPKQPSRVWAVVHATRVANGDAALTALFSNDFDPAEAVILEQNDPGLSSGEIANPSGGDSESGSPAAAQIIRSEPDDVSVHVSLPADGYLVLSDTYYPGWAASLDGQPAPILHADYAFRGVAVPAGDHTVEFRYRPVSFRIGLWITAISAIFLAGICLVLGIARKR